MIFNLNVFAISECIECVPKSIYAYYKNMSSSTNRFNPNIIETEREFHRELNDLLLAYNLTGKKWMDIKNMSLLNGLYAVAYRIALSREKNNVGILKELILEVEYKNALSIFKQYKTMIPKKKYLALAMMEKGNVHLAVKYMEGICMIKKIYYKKNKSGVVYVI